MNVELFLLCDLGIFSEVGFMGLRSRCWCDLVLTLTESYQPGVG